MESVSRHPLVSAAKGQLFSCYQMLETLVDVRPDEIWQSVYGEVPFWYQVYHTAYFVDYWLREDCSGADFPSLLFDPRIPPEFEWAVPQEAFLSRGIMRLYLRLIRQKLNRICASLADSDLARPALDSEPEVTLLDAIFSQARHIMYNVGYCNGILRRLDLDESDWYAYNERDE